MIFENIGIFGNSNIEEMYKLVFTNIIIFISMVANAQKNGPLFSDAVLDAVLGTSIEGTTLKFTPTPNFSSIDQSRLHTFLIDGEIILDSSVKLLNQFSISQLFFQKDSNKMVNTLYVVLPKKQELIDSLWERWGRPGQSLRFSSPDIPDEMIETNFSWKLASYHVLLLQGLFPERQLIIIHLGKEDFNKRLFDK
jgi:hypothetical protein